MRGHASFLGNLPSVENYVSEFTASECKDMITKKSIKIPQKDMYIDFEINTEKEHFFYSVGSLDSNGNCKGGSLAYRSQTYESVCGTINAKYLHDKK